MDNNLKSRIKVAIEREWAGDRLTDLEKKVLCDMVREQHGEDMEMLTDEAIYDFYVINA